MPGPKLKRMPREIWCLFCRQEQEPIIELRYIGNKMRHRLHCDVCGANGPWAGNRTEAFLAWVAPLEYLKGPKGGLKSKPPQSETLAKARAIRLANLERLKREREGK